MKIIFTKSEVEDSKKLSKKLSELTGKEVKNGFLTTEEAKDIKCCTTTETETEYIIDYKPEFSKDMFGLFDRTIDIVSPLLPILQSAIKHLDEAINDFIEKWV